MDYVHFNPVKHHLAETPADWPFSSFRHCVARGICPADWMPNDVVPQGDGERDALHKA
jgi:putative transposase